MLPGGSRKTNRHHSVTFLDCINVNTEQTFYVLDCMIWKDFSLYDCDTECRRFMLQSHLDENDQLGIKSNVNPWIFKMLPSFPCDPDSLHTALMSKVTRDRFRFNLTSIFIMLRNKLSLLYLAAILLY